VQLDLRPFLSFPQEPCRGGLGSVRPSKSSPLLSCLTQGAKQRPRLHHHVCCGSALTSMPGSSALPLVSDIGRPDRHGSFVPVSDIACPSQRPGGATPVARQQRLRLFQIERVEPFGEPATHPANSRGPAHACPGRAGGERLHTRPCGMFGARRGISLRARSARARRTQPPVSPSAAARRRVHSRQTPNKGFGREPVRRPRRGRTL
jgi:hypothetical protein